MTNTLIEGFEAAEGVEVRIGAGTRRNASRAFHRNITQWLREGDLFIWIGVNHAEAPWEQLARRGIRRVVYQTEPTHSCEGAHRNRMDELWDFSGYDLLDDPASPLPTLMRRAPHANPQAQPRGLLQHALCPRSASIRAAGRRASYAASRREALVKADVLRRALPRSGGGPRPSVRLTVRLNQELNAVSCAGPAALLQRPEATAARDAQVHVPRVGRRCLPRARAF